MPNCFSISSNCVIDISAPSALQILQSKLSSSVRRPPLLSDWRVKSQKSLDVIFRVHSTLIDSTKRYSINTFSSRILDQFDVKSTSVTRNLIDWLDSALIWKSFTCIQRKLPGETRKVLHLHIWKKNYTHVLIFQNYFLIARMQLHYKTDSRESSPVTVVWAHGRVEGICSNNIMVVSTLSFLHFLQYV